MFSHGPFEGFPSCSCSASKMREQRDTKSCSSFGLVFSEAPSRASLFSFKKLSPPFLLLLLLQEDRAPRTRSVSAMRSQQRKEEKQRSLFRARARTTPLWSVQKRERPHDVFEPQKRSLNTAQFSKSVGDFQLLVDHNMHGVAYVETDLIGPPMTQARRELEVAFTLEMAIRMFIDPITPHSQSPLVILFNGSKRPKKYTSPATIVSRSHSSPGPLFSLPSRCAGSSWV